MLRIITTMCAILFAIMVIITFTKNAGKIKQEEYDRGYNAAMDSIQNTLERTMQSQDTIGKIQFVHKKKVVYFIKPDCIKKK